MRQIPAEIRETRILTSRTASRDEILRKTPPIFKPDISYLKHGSSNSLASRLARPQLQAQEKAAAIDVARARAKAAEPAMLSPDELSQITERRKLERMARQAQEADAVLSNSSPLSKDIMLKITNKPSITLPLELPSVQEIGSAPAQSAMNRRPYPQVATKPHRVPRRISHTTLTAEQQKTMSDSIAKRKAEREARLQREASGLQSEAAEFEANGYQPARMGSKRPNTRRQEKVFSEEPVVENADEGDAEGYRPQFTEPQAPSNLLDMFAVPYHPSSEQDYSRYTTHTPNAFTTPPDMLGAIRFAEVTLAHQRSIALPQRKHALNLISRACAPKPRQLTAS